MASPEISGRELFLALTGAQIKTQTALIQLRKHRDATNAAPVEEWYPLTVINIEGIERALKDLAQEIQDARATYEEEKHELANALAE